jgi:hypothetical protein
MTRGKYTRDFYFIPTILYHDGDGIYASVEFAWLKWYIGFCWTIKEDNNKAVDIAIKALEQENEVEQMYNAGRHKGMKKALKIIKKQCGEKTESEE